MTGTGTASARAGGQYQNEYAYDRMNRLLESVQDGKAEKYTYDLAGNRLRRESGQKTEVYQYNAKNQLTSICSGESIIQYLYDKQGNMLEEQGDAWTKRYTYDAANRQTGIELTGPSETTPGCFRQISRYDGEGLRYETEENGKTIRFLYDRGELAEEKQEDAYNSYARGYDPLVLTQNGTDQSYFVPDEMGSTLFLLDRNHEIRKTYHYDAFGAIKDETGEISNRLTFTGQMYDGETGQYYLRARFYNPLIGRFTQEDIYRGDGLNLYAYCANNPVMYYDPSGYAWLCELGKNEPAYMTKEEVGKMIEFPGAAAHPKTITMDNPDGIYIIRATGDYYWDRLVLANEIQMNLPNGKYWKGHHIEYNFETNQMRMQFIGGIDHGHYHFGGAVQFERITGFKYGSKEAMEYCMQRNREYLVQLIKFLADSQ